MAHFVDNMKCIEMCWLYKWKYIDCNQTCSLQITIFNLNHGSLHTNSCAELCECVPKQKRMPSFPQPKSSIGRNPFMNFMASPAQTSKCPSQGDVQPLLSTSGTPNLPKPSFPRYMVGSSVSRATSCTKQPSLLFCTYSYFSMLKTRSPSSTPGGRTWKSYDVLLIRSRGLMPILLKGQSFESWKSVWCHLT